MEWMDAENATLDRLVEVTGAIADASLAQVKAAANAADAGPSVHKGHDHKHNLGCTVRQAWDFDGT